MTTTVPTIAEEKRARTRDLAELLDRLPARTEAGPLMLHTDERTTCPIVGTPGNYHFSMRCEDCDVAELARLNLGQVEDRYQTGRITQDEFEAYTYVWALLSPSGSRPEWRAPLSAEHPTARRIARKLLRARGVEIPVELAGSWRAVNDGTGPRRWFLVREDHGCTVGYHERADGNLVRYGSPEAACRAADQLNRQAAEAGR